MATVIETTDISTAYEKLSALYGVRRLTASGGRPYVRIDHDQLGPAGLHRLAFAMDFSADGSPMGAYFFGQVNAGTVRYRSKGGGWQSPLHGPSDTFLAVQPDISWYGDHTGADLEFASLDAALIAQAADTGPGRRATPIRFTGDPPAPRDARLWLSTFRHVRSQADTTPAAREPLLAGALAQMLGAAALAVFPNTALTDPASTDRNDAHTATLRRATAFIDEHAHRDITVADIAAAAYVTIRAVQLAFQRHLGTTPTGYLRQVRLSHAHRDLLTADPARDSVTAVAYRWGFLSPSRFASLHRAAYGVPPSHTLHQH